MADAEFARIEDKQDKGLIATLSFEPSEDIAAPYIAKGVRPGIAVLREQGVNGHVEMAAAFDRAGFRAVDVHMSDIISGRISLADFQALPLAVVSRTATCWARAKAGPSPFCLTHGRVLNLKRSLAAAIPSAWACVTVAR